MAVRRGLRDNFAPPGNSNPTPLRKKDFITIRRDQYECELIAALHDGWYAALDIPRQDFAKFAKKWADKRRRARECQS